MAGSRILVSGTERQVRKYHRGLIYLTAFTLLAVGLLSVLNAVTASAQTSPDPQLQEGARLYAENCAVCHGDNGEGRIGATLAKDWPSVRPDLTVKTIIESGIPGSRMPAWSEVNGGPLNAEQIDAVVAYILSWQTGGSANIIIVPTPTPLPPVTPVPGVQGDTVRGAALFQKNCILCHGEGGQGKIGKTLAKDWSGVRPDLFIKSTISGGIPNTAMPAWDQANGGPLSEQEINDVVAFVIAMPKTTSVEAAPEPAEATSTSWFSGWGGILVFAILLGAIIAVILYLQRPKPQE